MARRKVVAGLPQFIDEFENFLMSNEILMACCQGRRSAEARPGGECRNQAEPMLRRCRGVNYDIRKSGSLRDLRPLQNSACRLAITGIFTTATWCACWRCANRFIILEQALKEVPAGPVMDPKAKIRNFGPKAGEGVRAYRRRRRASLDFI